VGLDVKAQANVGGLLATIVAGHLLHTNARGDPWGQSAFITTGAVPRFIPARHCRA